ncbi:uncharacterized protein LOC131228852 [Magnolia sinica]|uniref:uncharacterized protein LOC131228852 n=1 Tax=Magnolia sinica TaxID=86752 RepID=UPI00265A39E6|nr:uncharacterized protein LOC131228852 [Magnolia sinica]
MKAQRLKLAWSIRFGDPPSPWAKLMRCKHGRDIHASDQAPPSLNPSPMWKKVRSLFPTLSESIQWTVGDGDLNFWTENWMGRGPLQRHLPCPIPSDLLELKVQEVMGRAGPFPPSRVFALRPQHLSDEIINGGFSTSYDPPECFWPHEKSGRFSMRSAWQLLRSPSPAPVWASWIWLGSLLPKFSIFMWRLLQNVIPVDSRVQDKGVAMASRCRCCLQGTNVSPHQESIPYLFLFGRHAQNLWNSFGSICGIPPLVHSFVAGKLNFLRNALAPGAAHNRVCYMLSILILWEIWRPGNNFVFDNSPMNSGVSADRIRWWANMISGANLSEAVGWKCVKRPKNSVPVHNRAVASLVKWDKPSPG